MGFSDIHAHFLYGMDDGAQTKAEMEAMLDASWADGVTKLVATPHMTPGIEPFDEDACLRRLAEAREYCRQRGYAIELYAGAELLYTPALPQYLSKHSLPTLAGSRQVLLEFAPAIPYEEIAAGVKLLERSGYVPVLAHVERYGALSGTKLYRLKEQSSVFYQLNGDTILHPNGLRKKLQTRKWLRDEIIDWIASDSHDCGRRKTCMKQTYTTLESRCDEAYLQRLFGVC